MLSLAQRHVRNALVLCVSFCLFGTYLSAKTKTGNSIVSIERNKMDQTPVSITFAPNAHLLPSQAKDIFQKYLNIDGANIAMQLQYSTTTKMKVTSDRYTEYINGIKVEYGSYTLMSKDGEVTFMTGNYYNPDENASSVASISEIAAFNYALGYVGAQKYMWQDPAQEQFIKNRYHKDTTYLPKGQLVWIENYNGGNEDRKLHLAYSFDIYASQPLSRQKVFVDATTGKVLYSNSMLKHTAATGHSLYSGVVPIQTSFLAGTYELFDSTRGNGVHTLNMHNGTSYTAATEFTSATNTWPDAAADTQAMDAQWGASRVYDYWDSVQGRLSWDNLNGELDQYVHYSSAYDNAFWDGAEMNYGDGSGCGGGGFTPLVSLDVTAHEIGHGVCQATCNLVYEKESGGIDEGLSDCWGATIENWGNPHETDAVPKKTWWMGEEIGCGTPLRRLDSPKLFGLPDTYLGTNWYDVTGCTASNFNDQCGVHTNMGVISKWYYLLTVGASGTNDLGNAYTVAGQTFTVSQNVLYQTELILASNATYPILRTTSIAAATTLYGACSPQVEAVTDAWYAVGVGPAFDPCVSQISFTNTASTVTENANTNSCTASHVVMIPIKATGPAIVGGTPVATVVATDGTAISGVDYQLTPTVISFPPADTATHYIPVTIYDNGNVGDTKYFRLGYVLDSAGTSTITSPIAHSDSVTIVNDDYAPVAGGAAYYTMDDSSALSNLTSPFYSNAKMAHSQFLIYADELIASGIVPNYPITQVAFRVAQKNSTQPFMNYTMSLANTTIPDMDGGFVTTGLTTVYTGDYTTYVGTDTIQFSTPFIWDGVSSVVMDVCYTNTVSGTSNDRVAGAFDAGGNDICAYAHSTTTGTGCTLPYNAMQVSGAKPVMRFQQIIAPSKVETTVSATRSWNVLAGKDVYFYALADTGVMVELKNPSQDLGCVNTTLTAEGTGFSPFSFTPGVNRSVKEFSITPSEHLTGTTYKATLYFTNAELGSANPSSLFIIKTDAATDAAITTANSAQVTPTIITGSNYTGFQGNFTGFSRYFLVDGNVPGLAVTNIAGADNTIKVDNNPFHDKIYVSYSVEGDMSATVRLYDITGRVVYSSNMALSRGDHKFTVDCSDMALAEGMYVMQVITPGNVYTRKLIKN